jgi:RNA 3'-terminal phosphate cyclase (ATP)
MDKMIKIDGSQGEGGGQILRSSLALSVCLQTPVKIEKIRAKRSKPGLMRQHLTAVRAAAEISDAEVKGDAINSRELVFTPKTLKAGAFNFNISTAGSSTLVFQTVLPALLRAKEPSSITVKGGTHNAKAPPFDFLDKTFLPVLRKMGPNVTAQLARSGFYPAGGGQISFDIQPKELARIDMSSRGPLTSQYVISRVAALPFNIVERELLVFERRFGWNKSQLRPERLPDEQGPGNVVLVHAESQHLTEVISAVGEKGVPAERVAMTAMEEFEAYVNADVPVGEHLADQLMLLMALGKGGSYLTVKPSLHTTTHAQILQVFLGTKIKMEPVTEHAWMIEVEP